MIWTNSLNSLFSSGYSCRYSTFEWASILRQTWTELFLSSNFFHRTYYFSMHRLIDVFSLKNGIPPTVRSQSWICRCGKWSELSEKITSIIRLHDDEWMLRYCGWCSIAHSFPYDFILWLWAWDGPFWFTLPSCLLFRFHCAKVLQNFHNVGSVFHWF